MNTSMNMKTSMNMNTSMNININIFIIFYMYNAYEYKFNYFTSATNLERDSYIAMKVSYSHALTFVLLLPHRRNGASNAPSESLRPNLDGSHHLQEYTYKKITACDVCSQILRGEFKGHAALTSLLILLHLHLLLLHPWRRPHPPGAAVSHL